MRAPELLAGLGGARILLIRLIMTFIIQFFGLIINLYFVFLFTSRVTSGPNGKTLNEQTSEFKESSINKGRPFRVNSKYWLSTFAYDQNRLELLNRISLLLLFSYFIAELDFILVTPSWASLSLIDGSIHLDASTSLIFLGVFTITMIL